jgi:hypothetical protein
MAYSWIAMSPTVEHIITAQRVVRQGQSGVNVYEYVHEDGDMDALSERWWPETDPGRLCRKFEKIPSGGNPVVSTLDVVYSEGISRRDVLSVIAIIKYAMPTEPNGAPYQLGPIWVRFWTEKSSAPIRIELAALAAHICLNVFADILAPTR